CDAAELNAQIFNSLYPYVLPKRTISVYFNPVNQLPITESLEYYALKHEKGTYWGIYLGSDKDLCKECEQGDMIRFTMDANYAHDSHMRAQASYEKALMHGIAGDREQSIRWFLQAAYQTTDASISAAAHYALAQLFYHSKNARTLTH